MSNKLPLPHGCSYSIAINPKNWKNAAANPKCIWSIKYRFYEPNKPMHTVIVKGMNQTKDLKTKQEITQALCDRIASVLKDGYNPRQKEIIQSETEQTENHTLESGLMFALAKKKLNYNTRPVIASNLRNFLIAARKLHYDIIPVNKIRRKHIIDILDKCEENPRFNANTYNHYRSNISILFRELVRREAIEFNPVNEFIERRKTIKKIREVLTYQQRIVLDKYLKENYYTFWRYLQIFFHSCARCTELFRIQKFHVDLEQQQYKAILLKGKNYDEVYKIITDEALPLWIELMNEANTNDYLFGKGLKPSPVAIQSYQITKRWQRLIKHSKNEEIKSLGIKATINSLKHLKSTAVSKALGIKEAAKLNSHKSEQMMAEVYDINYKQRENDELKSIKTPFVPICNQTF
jgi:integrase